MAGSACVQMSPPAVTVASAGPKPAPAAVVFSRPRRASLRPCLRCAGGYYGGRIPPILRALETVQDVGQALKPWEDTLSNKERSIILKEQPCWERALEIFAWFKAKQCYELNVIHYNILLRALGRTRRWDLVARLWCEMQDRGVAPTNPTYGTLVDVYSKGGLEREALLWLADMYKRGLEPDEVTIGIVMQAHKKAGEFGEAQKLFEIWSSTLLDASMEQRCFSPHTYNALIDLYGKAGKLKEASEVFSEMLKRGVVSNTVTFNTMIHICGNHDHLEEMTALLSKMEELKCRPDTRTYNILISVYVKADDIDAAAACLSSMKVAGIVPDIVSYRTLLYAFSIRNMVGEAEMLVMEMEQQALQMDEFTQSALTRMYISSGMLEKSWLWFDKFQDEMSSECYAANIDAFGENGQLSLAEKAFYSCLARGKQSVLVYNVMIKAFGIAKNINKACEAFDCMEEHHLCPDKCAFTSIIQILCAADLPQKGIQYIRKMQKLGFVDNCVPYSSLISSFARVGRLIEAEDLFNEMIGLGVQPDIIVFGTLIDAFAEAGNAHETKKYVDLMYAAGFSVNPIICNSLLKLYTRIGHLQEAQKIFQLLQSLQDEPNLFASNCMVDLYCEHAMVNEAEHIFQGLRQRGDANEFSFSMMINMYKKLGLFGKALSVAQEMCTVAPPSEALSYNSLIGLYVVDGRMKEASQLFIEMLRSGIKPNDSTFGLLGMGLIKRGAPKEAIRHLEMARKRDAQGTLDAWKETICSIVECC